MERTAKQRLIEYLKIKGIGQTSFEKKAGLSNGYIHNLRNAPSPTMLQKILLSASDLNRVWLLTGEAWFPDLSLYWARHTWATLAAEIDIPIETIARALGHSNGMNTTNIYINFSTKKIDDAQNKVIDYIFGDYCID